MPQYEVEIKERAVRALHEQLPLKIVDVILNYIYGPLKENPQRAGKKLNAPFEGDWSGRRGDYRVIYQIDDAKSLITVLDIEHRAHAYASRLKRR